MTNGQLYAWRYGTFTEALRSLRALYPFSVTSWWRTVEHNNGLPRSVPNSLHLEGLAVDVVFDPDYQLDTVGFSAAARARALLPLDEGDHWHLELHGI